MGYINTNLILCLIRKGDGRDREAVEFQKESMSPGPDH